MSRKTENQIWADLNDLLTEALAYWNIEGWQIARSYQPTKGNFPPPILLLRLMSSGPVGTEERTYHILDDELIRRSKLWENWIFRVEAIKKRIPGKPERTTSLDVLGCIRQWFNAPEGAEAVRKLGYNALLVNISPVPEFLTDSEVYEVAPYIELNLFLQQTHERNTPAATVGDVIIKGV